MHSVCVLTLFEDFRGHVLRILCQGTYHAERKEPHPGRSADLSQLVQLLFLHDATETKVSDHDVCLLLRSAKQ